MRSDGTFIAVEVDDGVAADEALARTLTEACPVDIFAQRENGQLEIVAENLDECVLCRLCLGRHTGGRGQGDQAVRLRERARLGTPASRALAARVRHRHEQHVLPIRTRGSSGSCRRRLKEAGHPAVVALANPCGTSSLTHHPLTFAQLTAFSFSFPLKSISWTPPFKVPEAAPLKLSLFTPSFGMSTPA